MFRKFSQRWVIDMDGHVIHRKIIHVLDFWEEKDILLCLSAHWKEATAIWKEIWTAQRKINWTIMRTAIALNLISQNISYSVFQNNNSKYRTQWVPFVWHFFRILLMPYLATCAPFWSLRRKAETEEPKHQDHWIAGLGTSINISQQNGGFVNDDI